MDYGGGVACGEGRTPNSREGVPGIMWGNPLGGWTCRSRLHVNKGEKNFEFFRTVPGKEEKRVAL